MTARYFATVTDLKGCVGQELSVSDWMPVGQERIAAFAHASDDHQWIHTDPARAARETPWQRTIAHGFLTLSLLSPLFASALSIAGMSRSLNYGFDRVRFPAAVVSGSRIRAHFSLRDYQAVEGGAQLTWHVVIECDGSAKPALVADWIMRCMA